MLQLKVIQIIQETEDIKTFFFQTIDNQQIIYKAGQFLTLVFNINGEEIRRSYSLNSAPNVDAALAISVKRIPNGAVSRYLHDHVYVGDSVQSLLPSGRFVVADKDMEDGTKTYFFVAAGSGITPIFSILKSLLQKDKRTPIYLIYQSTNPENTLFYEKLKLYTEGSPNLQIQYFWSKPALGMSQHLNKDALIAAIAPFSAATKKKMRFYLCGPMPFMRMAKMALHVENIKDKQIFEEEFVIPTPFMPYTLTDFGKPTQLTIHFNKRQFTIPVPYKTTLLQAALDKGIALPFSCKGGACTTCICKTTHGKVVMPANYKIFDAEILRGVTLSCIAYADSEAVEIVVN